MRSANPLFSCNKILSARAWLFSVPSRRTACGRLLFCAWSSVLTLIHLHLQRDVISFQLDGSGQEVEWLLVLLAMCSVHLYGFSMRKLYSVLFCVYLMFQSPHKRSADASWCCHECVFRYKLQFLVLQFCYKGSLICCGFFISLFFSFWFFCRPSGGGKYCLGERKRYRSCNTDVSFHFSSASM